MEVSRRAYVNLPKHFSTAPKNPSKTPVRVPGVRKQTQRQNFGTRGMM